MTRSKEGPRFVRYFGPILVALKDLGNSGRPSEVSKLVAQALDVRDSELQEMLKSGQSRFEKNIHWARFYLAKDGLIEDSRRGVWSLTEKGRKADLSHDASLDLFQRVQTTYRMRRLRSENDIDAGDVEPAEPQEAQQRDSHREQVADILRAMPAAGFERFAQRLLREAGFEEVEVTGRSGDGGIDGRGMLQINPLVSIKVLFQCKRWKNSVSPSQIRDFQGALRGRADKGIFLTTGTFTAEAQREATRDGAEQVELIDLERLLDLMEKFEIGVKRVTAFRVEYDFFDQFNQ